MQPIWLESPSSCSKMLTRTQGAKSISDLNPIELAFYLPTWRLIHPNSNDAMCFSTVKRCCCLCCSLTRWPPGCIAAASSPCVLICNSHLSSCLPAAFRCTPSAHLNIALCFLLPLSSFFPSCTRVEVSQLPLHQGWLVPHLGQPEQASPHARPQQTSPNLDTGWCSYCKHRTCNHVTSVHLKIWCFAASNAVF